MHFKKAKHRHDGVGSQVCGTIVIILLEAYVGKADDILQMVLELPDEILREFHGASTAIYFGGGEVGSG
jgi:hypothetical protein